MPLYEIDPDATRRRLEEITTDGLRALREIRQQSEDIDKSVQELLEQREIERQALDEQVKAAAQPAEPEPEAKPKPKPSTLALGGDEFRQARVERQTAEEVRPAPAPRPTPPAEPEPEQPTDVPQPSRTLKFGAPEDRDDTPLPEPAPTPLPEHKPVRRRPPRPEGDDDMSGRTWLR